MATALEVTSLVCSTQRAWRRGRVRRYWQRVMRVACCVGEAAEAAREADLAEAAEAAQQGAWAVRETEVCR